jgi:hypothetical protein
MKGLEPPEPALSSQCVCPLRHIGLLLSTSAFSSCFATARVSLKLSANRLSLPTSADERTRTSNICVLSAALVDALYRARLRHVGMLSFYCVVKASTCTLPRNKKVCAPGASEGHFLFPRSPRRTDWCFLLRLFALAPFLSGAEGWPWTALLIQDYRRFIAHIPIITTANKPAMIFGPRR